MNPDGGRVGVVMPHGVLFRGGAEAKIRQCLIEDDRLEAVIGLPPNLFYSTSIPACILVFRSQKPPARKGHVLFVDGAARFTKAKNRNEMMPKDIAAILAAYETADDPDGDGGVAVRLASHSEIEANGWDLNIGRYLKTAAADEVDLDTALAAYLEARENRIAAEHALFQRLTAAGIADLGDPNE
jgi:type I restriction enzyme M protein